MKRYIFFIMTFCLAAIFFISNFAFALPSGGGINFLKSITV